MNKKVKREIISLVICAIVALVMGFYVSHHPEKFSDEAIAEKQAAELEKSK